MLTFIPGDTSQTFQVTVNDDVLDENHETLKLTLSNASNASLATTNNPATLTIDDNDPPPTVDFSSPAYSVGEGAGTATITVTLDAPSALLVSVDYATSDGTAVAPGDYISASGMLTFLPGDTSQTFQVTVNDDVLDENHETLKLTLSNANNASLGTANNPATLTIHDDDAPPTVDFSGATYSIDEGAGTATMTDPIPMHTTYVTGSAHASDGNLASFADGDLYWSGQVVSGTPVVFEFAVEVQTAPIGTSIDNRAQLEDGLGNVMKLEARSTYNPGYGLTINDGALCTSILTVTLRLSWHADDNITHVKISNDGGFGPASNTSDWISIDPQDPTYVDWALAIYGDLLLPRTVYVKFRDASGGQHGPIQDDIIYDPGLPQVTKVEIITQTIQAMRTTQSRDVIVRVTSSDDNSGVGAVRISHDEDFAEFSEFPVTGRTTDIPWTLQSSAKVYVRVMDRAGNLSEVCEGQGPPQHVIYLPIVLRARESGTVRSSGTWTDDGSHTSFPAARLGIESQESSRILRRQIAAPWTLGTELSELIEHPVRLLRGARSELENASALFVQLLREALTVVLDRSLAFRSGKSAEGDPG